MAYATANDVALRLGRELDESEAQIVGIRLEDAERLIRMRIKDLHGLVLDGEIDEGDVAYVEAEAVLRLIRNPDGFQTETDGNYTYAIDARVASGKLEILDDEWSMLGVRRGAFVIVPKICLPGQYLPHPQYDFNPPLYGHDPEHPAVWWGEDESP
jgi:hypothetical protein